LKNELENRDLMDFSAFKELVLYYPSYSSKTPLPGKLFRRLTLPIVDPPLAPPLLVTCPLFPSDSSLE
jgi:hypothetical protein